MTIPIENINDLIIMCLDNTASDIVLETSLKNESEKNIFLQKKIFGTFAESSERALDTSDTSDTSDSSSNVIEESPDEGVYGGEGQISFVTHNNKVSEHAIKPGNAIIVSTRTTWLVSLPTLDVVMI
jgi:hypothetical protein